MSSARSCSLALRALAGTVLFFGFFEGGFHSTQEVGGLGGIFQSVPLFFERFVRVGGSFDRKADATFRLVETDDAGFDFLAGFENIFDLGDTFFGNLRNVDEAVELSFKLDEGAKAGDFAYGSLDHLTDLEPSLDLFPRIFGELLESERDSLVCLVDSEDLGFHRVSFFEDFGSVCRLACPRHIGNVDHAVDALFELDKGAIGGGVSNDSLHGATHRVAEMDLFPRVCFEVANGKGKFLLFLADADDDGIDFLTILKDVAWAGDPARPGELGNVDKSLHAGLELNKGAVRHEAGDFAADLEIDRIFLGNLVPRILRHLFQSERDTEAFLVDFQNKDIDFLAGLEHFGRVTQAAPGHIGHVEKAVETIQIDEGAEFGQIFYAAFHFGSLVEVGEKFRTFLVSLFFDEFAAREDDVLAVFVEFYDPAFQCLSEEFPKIFRGVNVDLRRGEERLDSDVDHETTFDDAFN